MKARAIPIACVILSLVSCDQQQETVIIANPPRPTVETSISDRMFNLGLKDKPIRHDILSSVIDSIEIIQLETTDESIIGSIGSVNALNNYLIVSDDMGPGKVLAFDRSGRFSHKIGSTGEGPEEYASANQVFIYDNNIYVYDRQHSKVIVYDVNGKYISSVRFNPTTSPSNLYAIDNGYIGTYAGYLDTNPFEIVFMTQSDSIIGKAIPFKYTRPKVAGRVINDYSSGRDLLFYTEMSDTIYRIADSKVTSVGLFGLYKDNEVHEYMEKTAGMDNNKFRATLFSPSDQVIVNHISLTALTDYWVVNWQTPRGAYMSVINLSNFQSENFIRTDRLTKYCDFPFYIIGADGNSFFSSLDESFFSLRDDTTQNIMRILEEKYNVSMPDDVDFENSNPLLVRFTLKNNLVNGY